MEKFKAIEWIAIDIASKYGLDKETFEKRLEFGNSLKEELKSTSLEQVVKKYVEEADEPDMFVRALLSMNDVLTTKYTNIPIGIDVSSSGPQIDCTGIRDLDGMVTTGAISEKVPNLYKEIQDEMQLYVPISLTRDQVKKATVPYVYGSVATPRAVFGDYYKWFQKAFFKKAKGVVVVNNALIDAWRNDVVVYEHTLPDGFQARTLSTKVMPFRYQIGNTSYTYVEEVLAPKEKGEDKTKALSANVTHSIDGFILRELHRRCNYDEDKYYIALNTLKYPKVGTNPRLERLEQLARKYNFYSWQAIEYLQTGYVGNVSKDYLDTLYNVLSNLYGEPFEVMSIHDEFMCLPSHVNVMKQVYNDILAELYASILLPTIICDYRQDNAIWQHVGTYNQQIFDAIRDNRYAIS